MLELLITAIGLGLFLSFSLGPVFFELINTSLRSGFRIAFAMEIGVVFSDLIYLLLALFSATKAIEYLNAYPNIKYVFSFIFVIFGLVSIIGNLRPKTDTNNKLKRDTDDNLAANFIDNLEVLHVPASKTIYLANMAKGFGMNAINPSVLIFWILICSTSIKSLGLDDIGILIFFSMTLGVMFSIDVLKIYFASRLQKYITPKALQIIGIIVGAIMIGVGVYFLFAGFDIPKN